MFRVLTITFFIYASLPAFAQENHAISERFPATSEVGSISELIPNYEEIRCDSQCEGERYACGQFSDAKSCSQQGAKLGCVWACK